MKSGEIWRWRVELALVTTTDGTNNAIVWVVVHKVTSGYTVNNGDTGVVVYAGGGANELMTGRASGTVVM